LGQAALKQSIARSTVDKDRTIEEEGIVLTMGDLSLLAEQVTEAINMVVGLPVMHYETLKEKYISSISGLHVIDSMSVTGNLLGRK
jgi:hypothetical protein